LIHIGTLIQDIEVSRMLSKSKRHAIDAFRFCISIFQVYLAPCYKFEEVPVMNLEILETFMKGDAGFRLKFWSSLNRMKCSVYIRHFLPNTPRVEASKAQFKSLEFLWKMGIYYSPYFEIMALSIYLFLDLSAKTSVFYKTQHDLIRPEKILTRHYEGYAA
jgi:hypothetical protein